MDPPPKPNKRARCSTPPEIRSSSDCRTHRLHDQRQTNTLRQPLTNRAAVFEAVGPPLEEEGQDSEPEIPPEPLSVPTCGRFRITPQWLRTMVDYEKEGFLCEEKPLHEIIEFFDTSVSTTGLQS